MNTSTFASIVQGFVGIINLIIPILSTAALALFFWGLVQYVYHSDDTHQKTHGRELIGWGLLALFVLFSLWGILYTLNESFFGSGISGSGSGGAGAEGSADGAVLGF